LTLAISLAKSEDQLVNAQQTPIATGMDEFTCQPEERAASMARLRPLPSESVDRQPDYVVVPYLGMGPWPV
jgi:hypothetical protein